MADKCGEVLVGQAAHILNMFVDQFMTPPRPDRGPPDLVWG